MTKIEIRSWGDFIGGTAWDAAPETELKKRMRKGINSSQHEIKALLKKIRAHERLSLENVRDEAVLGLIQILRSMGAEIDVITADSNDAALFKKWPKR